ncbi:helix-turn-helix domain-containing protein [Halopiger djelfimassiliensis]|uniref:helix-turn-helix domain-containing protein n=1 Tax=Halopiger djelfimassiliensis TaxID=1293047 RepID=UPI0006777F33|nr:helix-turn-helix domain-containing protein [Halopiger djelfimassiliensis]
MSLLAEFEAASSALVLGPTLAAMPSLEVDLERQYALDPERPIAFCWIQCRDFEQFERTLDRDETIANFERINRRDESERDRVLYRLQQSDSDVVHAYRQWVSVGGQLLDCRGSDGRWEVEMRFPDRDAFSRYQAFLERENVAFELHRIADGSVGDRPTGGEVLTESQREALVLAYEGGFFEIPRETKLSAVAETLEISTQSVSERLRRGQAQLIEDQLL